MVKTVDKQELARLIGVVEGKLADLPVATYADGIVAMAAYRQAAELALSHLARTQGARVGHGFDHHRLGLAGINSTCTYSAAGVMKNWLQAARRKLEAMP